MLFEVITGAVDSAGITAPRSTSLRGQLRLRRRPGVLVRAEHRRHRRVAAASATRTSRWTARGRCTRRGSACSSATSTSRSRWARAARRPPIPRSIYPMEMDPYYLAPLGADAVTFAALQARALIDAGKVTERQMAEVASRCRRDARATPTRRSRGDFDVDDLLAEDYVARRCAATTCRRSPTAPCAVVIARGRQGPRAVRATRCGSPASPTAASSTTPACATSRASRRPPAGGQGGRRSTRRRSRWPSSRPRSPTRSRCCVEALGLGRRRRREPVGRPAGGQPDHGDRPRPRRRGGAADHATATAHRTLAHSTSGPCLQQNLVCVLEGSDVMAHQPCAIVGIGQTHHKSRRRDVSLGGLVREAAAARARRRADDVERHRRRRRRQGARPLRGRDEARAVPHRRARRGGQADVPRAHRRLGRRHHRHRRRATTSRPGATSGCSVVATRSSPRATRSSPSGRARAPRSAPAARSRRTCAATSHRTGAPERRRADGRGEGPPERD